MICLPPQLTRTGLSFLTPASLALGFFLLGCSSPSSQLNFPPSASDFPLPQSEDLCISKADFVKAHPPGRGASVTWGAGEELQFPAHRRESPAEESFFFDEDGLLVGFLILFREPPTLEPYPVLRDTLSQLKPTVEFYQDLAKLPSTDVRQTAFLYMTGDDKSTTQYLVTGHSDSSLLLAASLSIDPYYQLLSPYRREFLERIAGEGRVSDEPPPKGFSSQDSEAFNSFQEFARGETALLAYCGIRREEVAGEAYQKAIAQGLPSKHHLAEAYHKLGLALKDQGLLEGARTEMERSLAVRPNRADVLNNLGEVYKQLGDQEKAITALEKAVTLKPNYPVARFNLAEAYERINGRRAIAEYETFLVLVEGRPEETGRAVRARQRLEALTR